MAEYVETVVQQAEAAVAAADAEEVKTVDWPDT
jgi:hypothetical protein